MAKGNLAENVEMMLLIKLIKYIQQQMLPEIKQKMLPTTYCL